MFNEDEKMTLARRVKGKLFLLRSYLYYHRKFKKKFSHIEEMPRSLGLWNVRVYGPNISLGKNVLFVAAKGSYTTLTTVKTNGHEGRIHIGDNVLIMNSVRISSAAEIQIGEGCMLANYCYLTDADWHDIHDRNSCPGRCAPIVLERGAWIGDSAIICKGVRIGENSIIGAGSVVTKDVPANVVAAGNPARVVKKLDPEKVVLREE